MSNMNGKNKADTTMFEARSIMSLLDKLHDWFDTEYIIVEEFEDTYFLDVYTNLTPDEVIEIRRENMTYLTDLYSASNGKIMIDFCFV